jgi:hypothetical protein
MGPEPGKGGGLKLVRRKSIELVQSLVRWESRRPSDDLLSFSGPLPYFENFDSYPSKHLESSELYDRQVWAFDYLPLPRMGENVSRVRAQITERNAEDTLEDILLLQVRYKGRLGQSSLGLVNMTTNVCVTQADDRLLAGASLLASLDRFHRLSPSGPLKDRLSEKMLVSLHQDLEMLRSKGAECMEAAFNKFMEVSSGGNGRETSSKTQHHCPHLLSTAACCPLTGRWMDAGVGRSRGRHALPSVGGWEAAGRHGELLRWPAGPRSAGGGPRGVTVPRVGPGMCRKLRAAQGQEEEGPSLPGAAASLQEVRETEGA